MARKRARSQVRARRRAVDRAIVIAEALTAVTLTRGPVAESVTQRSAVISFRTSAPDHDSVVLQGGAPIDAGTGVDHVAMLTGLTPGKRYDYTVEGPSGALAA